MPGRTARFYRKNPKAYAKKLAYDKKYNKKPKNVKKRSELNKYNKKRGTYGNGDGLDASHKGGKIVGFEKASKNRARREKSRLKGSRRRLKKSRTKLRKYE